MRTTRIRLGDVRKEKPITFGGDGVTYEGRVVYIHPRNRYYTVEFQVVPLCRRMVSYHGRGGRAIVSKGKPSKIRESFLILAQKDGSGAV